MTDSPSNPSGITGLRLLNGRLGPAGRALCLAGGDTLLGVDGKPFTGDLAALRGVMPEGQPRALTFRRGQILLTVLARTPELGVWEAVSLPDVGELPSVDPSALVNWDVLRDRAGQHDLVCDAPSVMALILPLLWLMQKRLWIPLLVFGIALGLGYVLSPWVALAVHLAVGLNLRAMAPTFLRRAGQQAGFRKVAVVAARSETAAMAAYRAIDPAARFVFAPSGKAESAAQPV